jgi:hypothetical protein
MPSNNITIKLSDIIENGGDCIDTELFIDEFGKEKSLNWTLEEQIKWLKHPTWRKYIRWGATVGLITLYSLDNVIIMNEDLSEIDLSGLSLKNTNLSGCNFSNAKLNGVQFNNSNLRNCKFINANLIGANLAGSDLSDSDLTHAQIQRIVFNKDTIFPMQFSHLISRRR